MTLAPLLKSRTIFGLVAIGATTIALVSWLKVSDPFIERAESALYSNPAIYEAVGDIEKIREIRTTFMLRNNGEGAAKEIDSVRYHFLVTGNSGSADAFVVVTIGDEESTGAIRIESINEQ